VARPKAFDVDEALHRALELFWLQGYHATSLPDLVDHMGIGRQSLYDTFGGKRQLFLRALDRYTDVLMGGALRELESPNAGPEAIDRFLRATVAYQTGKPLRTGCFMVNSAMELAASDREVAARAAAYRLRMVEAFRRALGGRQRDGGPIPADDIDTGALHLTATVFGMIVAAKAGAQPEALQRMAQGALQQAVPSSMRRA